MDVCAEWRAESEFTLERQILILKGCACASQGTTAGAWVSLESWGCWCTEKPLGAGSCAQIPEELDASQAPASLGSPAGSPGSPGVSGSLAFAALLQTMPREVPGVEQHLGKDCKQHPNNLCERIHSLGSAQSCNQHPQNVSSLAPALSAWTNHSQRDSVPRSPGSGRSLVGRSSVSCSRSVSSSPSDCRRAGSC